MAAVALRLKAIDNFAFGARGRATVAAGAADHAAQRRIVALDARRARKGSRNRASFTDIFPFTVCASYSVNVAPGRHAVTAGISSKVFHTVDGDWRMTKLSSKQSPWRGSSAAVVGAAAAAGLASASFGTNVANGAASAAPAFGMETAGCCRRASTTLRTALTCRDSRCTGRGCRKAQPGYGARQHPESARRYRVRRSTCRACRNRIAARAHAKRLHASLPWSRHRQILRSSGWQDRRRRPRK